ncbi:MAG: hypothetical protein WBO10_03965 [Pyrinomonadaceae bacterium]
MKKIKKLTFTLLLLSVLAGNIFASGSYIATGVPSILSFLVEQVTMFLDSGDCPPRLCQTCRPNSVIDENGNCRPRED